MWRGFVAGDHALTSIGDTHPMWSMAYARAEAYRVIGASAVGYSHLKDGSPRDDAFVIRCLGPWLAVAVSDGLGSRYLSRYGSSYAVDVLSRYLLAPLTPDFRQTRPATTPLTPISPPSTVDEVQPGFLNRLVKRLFQQSQPQQKGNSPLPEAQTGLDLFRFDTLFSPDVPYPELQQVGSVSWWATSRPTDMGQLGDQENSFPIIMEEEEKLKRLIYDAFDKTHQLLKKRAEQFNLDVRDLGCTAVGFLFNMKTGQFAAAQVGDGGSVGLTTGENVLELVQAPETEEPTATATITSPRWEEYLVSRVWSPPVIDPFTAFFIMSDGVSSDLLYSPDHEALIRWAQVVEDKLRSTSTPMQAAAGLLHWLATYKAVGSWDDRTLVAIVTEKGEKNSANSTSSAE